MGIEFVSSDSICLDARDLKLNRNFLISSQFKNFIPSDKSTTHRLILLASMIRSRCTIIDPLLSLDTLSTINACLSCGVEIKIQLVTQEQHVRDLTDGVSLVELEDLLDRIEKLDPNSEGSLQLVARGCFEDQFELRGSDETVRIDCSGSGTSARLLLGILSSFEGARVIIDGSSSLRRRPMGKLVTLLKKMGADIKEESKDGSEHLPLRVEGKRLSPVDLCIDQGSAQLKSSLILASLGRPSCFRISLPEGSRRSTELICEKLFLKNSAGTIKTSYNSGIESIEICQTKKIEDFNSFCIEVLADPSSIAYIVVLISFLEPDWNFSMGSLLYERDRFSWLDVFSKMGLDLSLKEDPNRKGYILNLGENSKKIFRKERSLQAVSIEHEQVFSLIDELPLIMGMACFCDGISSFYGVEVLKDKESDRILGIQKLCKMLGSRCDVVDNSKGTDVFIHGLGIDGVKVCDPKSIYDSFYDHRLVMTAVVCGICSRSLFKISDVSSVKESFPSFFKLISKMFDG